MDQEKPSVCVLDASTYVGFWILKGLLDKGYTVHAAVQTKGQETEIEKKIKEMESGEERLSVFSVDILDYHSILVALKGCSALFCCLDSPDGYDLWYGLAKTLSEQAAWALAMDRLLNMVSVNAGLVLGPAVAQQNPCSTMSYLKGAAEMFENGVLAVVDVTFLADVHIRAFEDSSTTGRYFCFNQIVNTEEEAVKLAESLSPLLSSQPKCESQGSEAYAERLRTKKLSKLVEGTA